MFDILHFFFEDDSLGTKEEQDAKFNMRRQVYPLLYNRPYTWQSETTGADQWGTQTADSGEFGENNRKPKPSTKPYIPPTPMNADAPKPFGNVLDAPIG